MSSVWIAVSRMPSSFGMIPRSRAPLIAEAADLRISIIAYGALCCCGQPAPSCNQPPRMSFTFLTSVRILVMVVLRFTILPSAVPALKMEPNAPRT